ncbi:mCG145969, partial [Mus musculus]
RHTTAAALVSQASSHTVPQRPPMNTSTRPRPGLRPAGRTRRTDPFSGSGTANLRGMTGMRRRNLYPGEDEHFQGQEMTTE